MKLNIYRSVEEVIESLAEYFIRTVNAAIERSGECNVVLSGGSSPKRLYELLASEPYSSAIDWKRVFFFFGDERYVPFDDPANNGRMVKEALLDPLQISGTEIFYISTGLKPETAAREYAKRITTHFKEKPIRFDVVLLGLGDDGHTASLFPHTPVLHEQKALVATVAPAKEQPSRITMTAAVLNEAYAIAFLVYGEKKAHAVKQVIEGQKDTDTYPAQLIVPEEGTVNWFLDEEAGRLLSRQ